MHTVFLLIFLHKYSGLRPATGSSRLVVLKQGVGVVTTTAESSVEEPQPLDSLAGGVFVGRQREMVRPQIRPLPDAARQTC